MVDEIKVMGGMLMLMLFVEVYMGLKMGFVDVVENNLLLYEEIKYYEVVFDYLEMQYVMMLEVLVFLKKIWDMLLLQEQVVICKVVVDLVLYYQKLWIVCEVFVQQLVMKGGVKILLVVQIDCVVFVKVMQLLWIKYEKMLQMKQIVDEIEVIK